MVNSEHFRRLSIEGFWVVFGQIAAILGALVGLRLVTELLTPAQYGELALGITASTLVNQTVFGPLANGVSRFYAPAEERGDLIGYLSGVFRLTMVSTGLVVFMTLAVVICVIFSGENAWIAIIIAAFIFSVTSGYNSVLNSIQNAARHRSIVALHQGLEPWLRFLLAVAFMMWIGAVSTVALVGYIVAGGLILLSQMAFFRRMGGAIGDVSTTTDWQIQVWRYAWPFSVFGIFTWMQLVSDRWALGLFATTKEVGLYTVLYQLGYYPISVAAGIAIQYISPIFFQRAGDATDGSRNAHVSRLGWKFTVLALGLTVLIFLLALLFHSQVFGIFVASKFSSQSYLLPWMLLAGGLFAAGQTISLNLLSQMKPRTMMAAKIVTALLGVVLNIAGAYWYGTSGVVIAGVIFSASYFIWVAFLAKNEGVQGA